jgi:hypothetical protein
MSSQSWTIDLPFWNSANLNPSANYPPFAGIRRSLRTVGRRGCVEDAIDGKRFRDRSREDSSMQLAFPATVAPSVSLR